MGNLDIVYMWGGGGIDGTAVIQCHVMPLAVPKTSLKEGRTINVL